MPAEWQRHSACWMAQPHLAKEWGAPLAAAQQEFEALAKLVGTSETLHCLRPDKDHYGDSWTRDTAPIFVTRGEDVAAVCFKFNGWGGSFLMPGDESVSRLIAERSGLQTFEIPMVLEGGAIEVDGEGTCLTTRDCVLNPNRGGLSESVATEYLMGALGQSRIIWLDGCLVNDHTDGHIDTLARFAKPGVVLCAEPTHADDPNYEMLLRLADSVRQQTDHGGRKLEVVTLPSTGAMLDDDGDLLAGSYTNYYLSNEHVIVPAYGCEHDEYAREVLQGCFPERKAVSLSSKAIVTGGGSFHCITQQVPSGA